MKHMKRRIGMFVMFLCMCLLTACGNATDITMNEDGTGSLCITYLMEEAIYNEYTTISNERLVKQLEAMGFVKDSETYKKVKYVSFKKSIDYKTTSELKSLLTDDAKYKNAFFKTSLVEADMLPDSPLSTCTVTTDTFQGVYPGSLERDDIGEDTEDYADPTEIAFTRISITFPNNITDSNGKKDGKTATWVLDESLSDQLLQATTVGKEKYPKDVKKPVIYGVKNGIYYRDNVEVTLSDDTGIKKATVNHKQMGKDEVFYNDAQYHITAYDFAGNVTKVSFVIDKTAPTIAGVRNKKYYGTTRTIQLSDKYGIKSATLNGKVIKNGTKVGKTGKYKLVVKDRAGNVRTASFVIDKVNPTITGVTNGKTYRSARTIKFSDKYGVRSATLNGNTIRSGKKVSKPGKYTVRVTDKAGNIKTVKFTVQK